MKPMSSASEITANFYHSMSNPANEQLQVSQGNEFATNFSQSEKTRPNKRRRLEEGEEPNGLSLELKLGLPDIWDIKKRITFSDINRDKSRLLLPTDSVKKSILPHWDESRIKNGVPVFVWDFDTETEHELKFKQWPSNGSYVLIENWISDFVDRRGLKEADEIGLYWDQSNSRFSFSLLMQASSN